jgi:hypothetical protein
LTHTDISGGLTYTIKPATGTPRIAALHADAGSRGKKYQYATRCKPYFWGRFYGANPQWQYQWEQLSDGDGLAFSLDLLVNSSLTESTISDYIKVYAFWKECTYKHDWATHGKVVILHPDDRYTWRKLELLPRIDETDQVMTRSAVMPGNNKFTTYTVPTGVSNMKWCTFKRKTVPVLWNDFAVPTAILDYQWFPMILRWFRVDVLNSATELWEKYCYPLNPNESGITEQEKPYEFWDNTNLIWDSDLSHYTINSSLWNDSDPGLKHMYYQRLAPARITVVGFNYPITDPNSYTTYRFPIGEYIAEIFDDTDDEEVAVMKQRLFAVSLPNTKVTVFSYLFNEVTVPEDATIPFPIWKGLYRKIYNSENWDYSEGKDYSTWLEVILDGVALIFIGIAAAVVLKFSKKIFNHMMGKWKWKKKLKSITGPLAEIGDKLEEIHIALEEEWDMLTEINLTTQDILVVSSQILKLQSEFMYAQGFGDTVDKITGMLRDPRKINVRNLQDAEDMAREIPHT